MINVICILSLFFGMLFLLAKPLGRYIAWIIQGPRSIDGKVFRILAVIEQRFCQIFSRVAAIDMTWKQYVLSILALEVVMILGLYALIRMQVDAPIGQGVLPAQALNIAISFATSTNWQSYVPEMALTPLVQTVGIVPVMFLSSGIGIAVAMSFIRSLSSKQASGKIGNFYVDLFRAALYILLPLACIGSLVLSSLGIPQETPGYVVSQQGSSLPRVPKGPVASYVAAELIGVNGGGFYNANCSHPFQNPSPLTHIIELLMTLLIPAALIMAFGYVSGRRRFSNRLYFLLSVMLSSLLIIMLFFERTGSLGASHNPLVYANMEGKECRFGTFWSCFWAIATVASSGATALSIGSLTPCSTAMPLSLMQMGEIIFGGVGVGFNGLMAFVVYATFTSGLMVGRTPEMFGKKIKMTEMVLVTAVLLIPLSLTLIPLAISSLSEGFIAHVTSSPERSLTELAYGAASCASGNGSPITTFLASDLRVELMFAAVMWCSRILCFIAYTALSGAFSAKPYVYEGHGTLRLDTPIFIMWIAATIIVMGLLSHIPTTILGPIFEQLRVSQAISMSSFHEAFYWKHILGGVLGAI